MTSVFITMTATDREIRTAAEVLLTGSSSSQLHRQLAPYFHSSYLHDGDVYVGVSQDNRMSVVRRFFCLFVTFDLSFTALMWLMCMMLVSGGNILSSLTSQVVHYNIQTSLFDIVMAAASRFTVLLLFYALLHSNHWCSVAISTAGTCAFLIAKVFLFDWAHASQPTFQVMLILVSFILAWGEAWFLDFRVLPQEMKAKEYLLSSTIYQDSDRNPLVRDYVGNLPGVRDNPESVFYSPLDTPDGSDDEGAPGQRLPASLTNKNPNMEYTVKARGILDTAWALLNSPDWRLEKETAEGDTIHSKVASSGPKVFRLISKVHIPPRYLLDLLFNKVEDMPSWNPTIIESRRLQVISEQVDITYQVTAAAAGGAVTSRDFVTLRSWDTCDGVFVSAGSAITHPSEPPHKCYIRGENLPSCFAMRPMDGEDDWCTFEWLANTNLKGWLPQYVVDTAFTTVMLDYVGYLRTYAETLRKKGVFA